MNYLYEVLLANFSTFFLSWLFVSLICNLIFDEGKDIIRIVLGSILSTVVIITLAVILSHFWPSVIAINPKTHLVTWGDL